jgi:carbon-monoxide dehydrogenase medium subunit
MLPRLKEFHQPETVDEALALLARRDVRTAPLYGGPELFDDLAMAGEVEAVVSLAGLGLDKVTELAERLHLGAMVRLAALPEGELSRAAARSYSLNLRDMWTIGAVVARGGATVPAAVPLLVTLLALDARVEVAGEGEAPVADYLPRRTPTDLVAGVIVPRTEGFGALAYAQVARTPADAPIVCAAARARVANGKVGAAALALGGAARTPIRAGDVEAALKGGPATAEAIDAALGALDALQPAADFKGSAEYRREMAKVMSRRVLLAAAGVMNR